MKTEIRFYIIREVSNNYNKEDKDLATIKDIANRLGVSVSTVSKGLNGASDISDELRQMVLDTAVEMGYATKRSKKVENRKLAIFIENMDYEAATQFGYEIVLGFKQNAFRHNWDVTVIPVTPAFQLAEKYDTYMLKNGFCGAFLVGFALHDEWMKQLEQTTMPTVLFDNYIKKNPNVAYIGTDNYEGIDAAVDHLYTLGHKKIAFLNGSLHSMVSEQRQEAYYNSMKAHGLEINEDLTVYGYYVADSGCIVCRRTDKQRKSAVWNTENYLGNVQKDCDRRYNRSGVSSGI